MRKVFVFLLFTLFSSIIINAQPASEKLFKQMISNLANHTSQPGTNHSLTFHEFNISKPVSWTMEYGRNASLDKNTKVYKVIARFTLFKQTYNTLTGQIYSSSSKEYKRPYHFYIDRTKQWVCVPVGLTSGFY